MRVLVTGAGGQLGRDVLRALARRGHRVTGVGAREMDLTRAGAVEAAFAATAPEAVVHCAAWTAVDLAETQPEQARLVNAAGTERVARCCRQWNSKLLYLSTDYVFDGTGSRPWAPEDTPNPINVYGRTKYQGEEAVGSLLKAFFIVRTSWVFGSGGGNFVKTMLELGRAQKTLQVVADQIGSPTYTADLSRLLAHMAETDRYGIYHATNEGECSWHAFAGEIFRQVRALAPGYPAVALEPVAGADWPAAAKRPANSRLNKDKLAKAGFGRLPPWQDALARFLGEIGLKEGSAPWET